MDGWSHFPSVTSLTTADTSSVRRRLLPEQYPQLSTKPFPSNIFRSSNVWNQQGTTKPNPIVKNMGPLNQEPTQQMCLPAEEPSFSAESTLARRNLAEAFELHVEPGGDEVSATPTAKLADSGNISSVISPSGVADLTIEVQAIDNKTQEIQQIQESQSETSSDYVPYFHLHPDLKRDLSQNLVNRVSFYEIIHDINKEANSMASNDFAALRMAKSMDEDDEVFSPLVVAVNGRPPMARQSLSMTECALIDEETWLLHAIEARSNEDRVSNASCPPTFLQAMGEREYENPLSSLQKSRTQLWKPSRSWWEAKSGKNPWIEPKSHNKRWR